MAPSRRRPETDFKLKLGHSANTRWKTVLAPYLSVSDATPSQLRSKARELALMNPTQLLQVKRDRQRQQRVERAKRRSAPNEVKRDYVIHVTVEMPNRSFGRPGEPETFLLERTFPEDGAYFHGSKLQEQHDIDSSFKAMIDIYAPRELRQIATNVDYVNLPLPYRERNLIEMRSGEPFHDASLPRIESMTPSTFADTNGQCVPTQLAELMLKPASNNPKKRLCVGGPKVTPESIEHWFRQTFPNVSSGITAEMVKTFAKFMDRHYYRLSPTGLIEEIVRHPNAGHYAPIAFVIKNNHMHLYNDASVFKALGHLQVGDVLYSAKLMQEDGAVHYGYPVDTPIDQLAPGEYRLRETSLNRLLGQVVAEQHYLPNVHTIKRRGHDITAFAYGAVRFVLDGAYQEVAGRGIGPTHTICKALCERADVEHTNETIGGLTAKLIHTFLTARRRLTDEEKEHLLGKQDWKCAVCECRLCLREDETATLAEFDHITPRAQGGGNTLKNFQGLCKVCHSDKSDRERLEGYAYKPFWESRFNAEVAKILLSSHGKCWVKSEVYEHVEATPIEALTLEVESLRRQSIQIAANVGGDLTEWKELIKRLQAANKRLFFALRQAGTRYQLDLNKCHRRALVETDEPVYQIGPLDNFKLYSETDPSKLAPGLYVVHSTNTTLLSGSGVYGRPIVQRAIQRGYDCTITHRLLPSHLHHRSKVREIVDFLNGLFVGIDGDAEVLRVTQKLFGGNAWVGLCAKTADTFADTELSVSPHDAALWADRTYEDALVAKKTVRSICLGTETLYEAVYARKRERDGIGYTFYQQDLEQEKIWLDELRERVEAAGGRVMHVNTDCTGFVLPECKTELVKELLAETWMQPAYNDECVNADGRALKYKLEEFAPPKFEQKPHLCRGPVLQVPVPDDWVTEYWHTESLEGYTEQASKLVTQSACVTGESGTGKSELIKAVAEECERLGRKYLIAGPTHLVARMHHGTTIAAYDYKYRLSKPRLHKTLKGVQNIVIDEAFMQGERYMELWNFVAKHYPRIIWTWVGDPDQFLPVKDTYTRGDYAENGFVKMLCGNRRLVLDKVHRCPDPEHLARVRAARDGKAVDLSHYSVTEHTWLHICLSHDTRKRLITESCERWCGEGEADEFQQTPRNPHSQDIKVQTGMPLICCRTSKKLDIYNGERYWYELADDEHVIVSRYIDDEFDQKVVPKEEFTSYFLLAFALTAHSVQGQTIKECYTIQDWTHPRADHRFRYVTLGRAKESGYVQIAPS